MNGWINATLGEIADGPQGFIDGPFGSNLPASDYVDAGVPVIRGSNLSLGVSRFNANGFVFVSEQTAERLRRSTAKASDIVFTKKGTIGQTGFVPNIQEFPIYILSSNQMRLRVDLSKADPLFVYYYVSQRTSVEKVIRDSEVTGVPKTSLAYFRTFPIALPSLLEQRAIASILGALDDKIDLNRRMNETLEAMARAIFKDWFIDFGATQAKGEGRAPYLAPEIWKLFPDRLEDESPKDWRLAPLTTFFSIVGGGTPKTSVPEYWNGTIPWFSVVDTPSRGNIFVVGTEKTITQAGLDATSVRLVPEGTTIISARGTVGNLAMAGQQMTFNQSCYGLRGQNAVGDCLVFLVALNAVSRLQSMAHGSVFSTITRQTFETLNLAKPPVSVLKAFEQAAEPLFVRIKANVIEAQTLSRTRDLLLPKLMSGEIRIKEAEKVTEAVL